MSETRFKIGRVINTTHTSSASGFCEGWWKDPTGIYRVEVFDIRWKQSSKDNLLHISMMEDLWSESVDDNNHYQEASELVENLPEKINLNVEVVRGGSDEEFCERIDKIVSLWFKRNHKCDLDESAAPEGWPSDMSYHGFNFNYDRVA